MSKFENCKTKAHVIKVAQNIEKSNEILQEKYNNLEAWHKSLQKNFNDLSDKKTQLEVDNKFLIEKTQKDSIKVQEIKEAFDKHKKESKTLVDYLQDEKAKLEEQNSRLVDNCSTLRNSWNKERSRKWYHKLFNLDHEGKKIRPSKPMCKA